MVLKDILILLLPLIILQVSFQTYALRDLRKNEEQENKLVWAIIVVLFGFIGPFIYFLWGKKS